MPRQIGHEGRRLQIADAVCRLADEHVLEGVTLRDVATRAGVSMGAVQRCFRTKEEMLVFALGHIGSRVMTRVRTRVAGSADTGASSTLRHTVTEVALVDGSHRAEARVWLAFVAQAAVTPSLAQVLRDSYAGLHELFVRLLREAAGNLSSAHAEREARALLALTDGLTAHTLIGHLSPAEALGVLDAHVDRLCGKKRTI